MLQPWALTGPYIPPPRSASHTIIPSFLQAFHHSSVLHTFYHSSMLYTFYHSSFLKRSNTSHVSIKSNTQKLSLHSISVYYTIHLFSVYSTTLHFSIHFTIPQSSVCQTFHHSSFLKAFTTMLVWNMKNLLSGTKKKYISNSEYLVRNPVQAAQPSATCILNIALPTRDGCDKF